MWKSSRWVRWCRSRPYLLDNNWNTSQNHSTHTLVQVRWCKSNDTSLTSTWCNISEIRGNHSTVMMVINRWKLSRWVRWYRSQPYLLDNKWNTSQKSLNRDSVHQNVNTFKASLTSIWRNISEIRGKIAQPWWWSGKKWMRWVRWCRSPPYLLDNIINIKPNRSQNLSTLILFISVWTPSIQARWWESD